MCNGGMARSTVHRSVSGHLSQPSLWIIGLIQLLGTKHHLREDSNTPIPSFRHPPSRFSPQTGCFTLTSVTTAQQSTCQQPSQPRLAKTNEWSFHFRGVSQPTRSITNPAFTFAHHSLRPLTEHKAEAGTKRQAAIRPVWLCGARAQACPFCAVPSWQRGTAAARRRLESGSSAAPQANRQPRVSLDAGLAWQLVKGFQSGLPKIDLFGSS